jgi:transcriptional regulator with XRE-family HTH domain
MLALVMIMSVRIRDMREDADLKQRQIAEYLMCDQSLYSKYERGERPFPLELAEKLADFYGVSVDYLLGRTDVKTPYPDAKRRGKK